MSSRRNLDKRHSHKNKKSREIGGVYRQAIAHALCPECGKHCYSSRRDAKEAAKIIFQGQKTRFYPCYAEPVPGYVIEYWHITTQDSKRATYFRERYSH